MFFEKHLKLKCPQKWWENFDKYDKTQVLVQLEKHSIGRVQSDLNFSKI